MKISRRQLRKIILEAFPRDEYGYDALKTQAELDDGDGEYALSSSQRHSLDRQEELKDMKLNDDNAYLVHVYLASALSDGDKMARVPAWGVAASQLSTRFSANSSDEIMPEVEEVLNSFLSNPKLGMMDKRRLQREIPKFKDMLRRAMDNPEF
tara:strand:+ start:12011 stop:12469 length:459 start_codon:yes stop_codon:yes gene_type:complete